MKKQDYANTANLFPCVTQLKGINQLTVSFMHSHTWAIAIEEQYTRTGEEWIYWW